ncbi:hypothetical protein V8C86DRAFT_2769917 [Haematococcus lacustris]
MAAEGVVPTPITRAALRLRSLPMPGRQGLCLSPHHFPNRGSQDTHVVNCGAACLVYASLHTCLHNALAGWHCQLAQQPPLTQRPPLTHPAASSPSTAMLNKAPPPRNSHAKFHMTLQPTAYQLYTAICRLPPPPMDRFGNNATSTKHGSSGQAFGARIAACPTACSPPACTAACSESCGSPEQQDWPLCTGHTVQCSSRVTKLWNAPSLVLNNPVHTAVSICATLTQNPTLTLTRTQHWCHSVTPTPALTAGAWTWSV